MFIISHTGILKWNEHRDFLTVSINYILKDPVLFFSLVHQIQCCLYPHAVESTTAAISVSAFSYDTIQSDESFPRQITPQLNDMAFPGAIATEGNGIMYGAIQLASQCKSGPASETNCYIGKRKI